MTEEIKSRMHDFYRTLASGDLQDIDQWVAPDFVDHALPPGFPSGREGLRQYFAALRRAFADFSLEVEDVVVEGDKVVARVSGQGTHVGELMGVPPTGKRVHVRFIDFDRFENGRIVEHWGVQDLLGALRQMGLVQLPAERRAA